MPNPDPRLEEMARETLERLIKQMRSDCDHARHSCEDIGCYGKPLENAIREVLARLDGALMAAQGLNVQLHEALTENRGHRANNENLADACKQYERRAVQAEAEVERLREQVAHLTEMVEANLE